MDIRSGQRTLRSQVQALLRNELPSGRFEPGERIKTRFRSANEIGVTRGTPREAIRAVEQEGILVEVPHRGTFLRSSPHVRPRNSKTCAQCSRPRRRFVSAGV